MPEVTSLRHSYQIRGCDVGLQRGACLELGKVSPRPWSTLEASMALLGTKQVTEWHTDHRDIVPSNSSVNL